MYVRVTYTIVIIIPDNIKPTILLDKLNEFNTKYVIVYMINVRSQQILTS